MSAGMLELTHLEAMLENDCGCESRHISSDNKVCGVTVTHRITSCIEPLLVCEPNAQRNLSLLRERPQLTCLAGCMKPIADCWRVVPV